MESLDAEKHGLIHKTTITLLPRRFLLRRRFSGLLRCEPVRNFHHDLFELINFFL